MGQINDLGRASFRDFVIDGLPASGVHEPVKREVRETIAAIDIALASLGVNGAITVKAAVKSTLDGDLAHPANTLAIVYNDVAANNGIYAKTGASGSGSWSKTALALPASFAGDLAAVLAGQEGVAAAVAASAQNAAAAASSLEEIRDIAAAAPEAPSIANKANLSLDNVPSATFGAKIVTPTGGTAQPLADALGLSVKVSGDLYGKNQGTVSTGSVTGKGTDRFFTGNASGGTIYYGNVDRVTSQGANAIASVRNAYTGLNLDSTGLITTAILNHGFVWKSGAGDVTNLRVWEGHVRHDGNGTVNVSRNFSISSITLGNAGATGTVTQSEGYSSGEIGHPTLVNRAYDFYAPDGSPCVALRAGFRSELQSHANKFAFQGAGTAQSAFGGWVAVGKATAPLNALDVTTTVSDFSARLTNNHPSTPWGVRIFFTAAAPNNTTQSFLRCEDSSGNRLHIWSNGNVVNVNNSYGAISDERLKTDIEAAAPVLDKFAVRRFVTYRLKADVDGPRIHGVIAQDETAHSPHLVTEGEGGLLSFNYAGLAVETGQAVQELLAEFRTLQAEVAKLRQGAGSMTERKTMAPEA